MNGRCEEGREDGDCSGCTWRKCSAPKSNLPYYRDIALAAWAPTLFYGILPWFKQFLQSLQPIGPTRFRHILGREDCYFWGESLSDGRSEEGHGEGERREENGEEGFLMFVMIRVDEYDCLSGELFLGDSRNLDPRHQPTNSRQHLQLPFDRPSLRSAKRGPGSTSGILSATMSRLSKQAVEDALRNIDLPVLDHPQKSKDNGAVGLSQDVDMDGTVEDKQELLTISER